MSKQLAARITSLSPSATLAVDAIVKKFQGEGKKIYNLSLGEPDFATPKNIQSAATQAMREGYTHYTTTAGIPELRKSIADKFSLENAIKYDPLEIVVGVGSKQLLYNALMVLCEEGDEVLVPVPTWSTYVEQVKLTLATPVPTKLSPPFKLTAKDVEKKVTKKTKVVILNSPANPTGAVIEKKELQKIAKLAVAKNIWILSDEIYEKLLYGGKHFSIASFGSDIKKRTVTINGFSKSYAMTGWRIGYAGGPKDVITAMVNLQSQTTSNTSSIAQYAGVEALSGSQTSIKKMALAFLTRRAFLLHAFSGIDRLSIVAPEGAFYLFINVEKCLNKKIKTSAEWCERLLEKEHVALVPGEAFLYPGWARMSFATSMDVLEEAVKRISRFVQNF
ncbi:MAG: pyridoxal phosphate-dependent aminotransferase [bacterium]|nr:pyridoxal phosphate-dependent aminotransferase [bacterium]